MSSIAPKNNKAAQVEEQQPKALYTPAPFILIGLLALLIGLGMIYVDSFGGELLFKDTVYTPYRTFAQVDGEQFLDPNAVRLVHGKNTFNANCAACHQSSGLGIAGQFPPLAGSEWVNAKSPARIIRGVLCGLQGPIKVEGQPYNNVMVPWKDAMDDQAISDVLFYVRTNKEWGNNASDVTPEDVAKIRKEVKDHSSAFTSDELLKIPVD